MKSFRSVVVGAGALLLATAIAAAAQAPPGGAAPAQGRAGQPPPPPKNLQILPNYIPPAELVATMRGFATGLGVMCNYCHVREGDGGRNDMASDEKAPKKTARVMMKMMAHVNETLAAEVGKPAADLTKVQCVTCHRGEAIPKNPPPPATPAPAAAPNPGL